MFLWLCYSIMMFPETGEKVDSGKKKVLENKSLGLSPYLVCGSSLSLSYLFSTPVANLLLFGWILSTKCTVIWSAASKENQACSVITGVMALSDSPANTSRPSSFKEDGTNRKLVGEVFVISRIVKVEGSRRLRLITLTETLSIQDITKTIFLYIERKKRKSCFCFFTNGKQHKAPRLVMIMRDLECPLQDFCIICTYEVTGTDFKNLLYAFGQSEKS